MRCSVVKSNKSVLLCKMRSKYFLVSVQYVWARQKAGRCAAFLLQKKLACPQERARDSHIRIRVIYDVVGPKGKRILDIINGVLSVFYCLLIAYAAFILAEKALFNPLGEFRLETTGSAWDPIYPALVKTGLFLVLITMTLQSLLHLVQAIFRKQPEA